MGSFLGRPINYLGTRNEVVLRHPHFGNIFSAMSWKIVGFEGGWYRNAISGSRGKGNLLWWKWYGQIRELRVLLEPLLFSLLTLSWGGSMVCFCNTEWRGLVGTQTGSHCVHFPFLPQKPGWGTCPPSGTGNWPPSRGSWAFSCSESLLIYCDLCHCSLQKSWMGARMENVELTYF